MASQQKVTLLIHVKLPSGKFTFAPPVYSKNGRDLKTGWARVAGEQRRFEQFRYYLKWREHGQQKYENVGDDPTFALAAQVKRAKTLDALKHGIEVKGEGKDARRLTIDDAITEYLGDVKAGKAKKTYGGRKLLLDGFRASCSKQFMDQIERRDMLDFINHLRKQKLGDRTVFNRFQGLNTFLRAYGIKGLASSSDWPTYTEKKVEAYSADELKALFAAADPEERLLFQFFLNSGFREGEAAVACYRDLDFESKTIMVKDKPEYGFQPKDKEERRVPLPDSLFAALKARREMYPKMDLIFPNKDGKPNGHFLRVLKALAKRAGLNCGHCANRTGQSCATHPVCDRFELHKFRKSFATMHHENGASPRSLQAWLGHSSLETTLAYLEIADIRSERTRDQVNSTFAGFVPTPLAKMPVRARAV